MALSSLVLQRLPDDNHATFLQMLTTDVSYVTGNSVLVISAWQLAVQENCNYSVNRASTAHYLLGVCSSAVPL